VSPFSIDKAAVRRARAAPRGARAARGFSLLEVLVAFVILATVATALFRLFSGALANASAADEYSRAVLVAESALTAAAATQPLKEATETGSADDGRVEWTTRVTPYSPPDVPPELETTSQAMAIRLYRVTVDVTFPSANGGKRTYALATTRIGPKDVK
jgi:general secretion pathway protein I